RSQSRDEPATIGDELLERRVEIHAKQQIVWIARAWIVRRDHRRRLREHLIESREKQLVHLGKVARVLVRRPFGGHRAALENRRRDFTHERQNDFGRALERVDNCGCCIHYWLLRESFWRRSIAARLASRAVWIASSCD